MKYFISFLFLFVTDHCMAQSVSINTDGSTANSSAILDVKSTTKGMLVPRMSKIQKNAISSPASGLLVYQLTPDSVGFHYFDGIQWLWLEAFANNNSGWKTTGNIGTTSANFLGNIDNKGIDLRQDNRLIGRFNSIRDIYAIGDSAAAKNSTGNPIAIGAFAGYSNNATNGAIYIGHQAGRNNTFGSGFIAIGDSALFSANTSQVIAIGNRAGRNQTTFISNIYIGQSAGYADSIGSVNLFVGDFAGLKNKGLSFPQGTNNCFIGMSAGRENTIGKDNSFFGNQAGGDNVNGNSNTFVGKVSGNNNIAGSFNTALGANTAFDESLGALSNATAIGYQALVASSNSMVLGSVAGLNGAVNNTNVGIGSTIPKSLLHIAATGVNAASSYYFPENNLIIEDTTFNATAGTITNATHLIANENDASAIISGSKQNPLTSSIVMRNNDRSLRFVTNAGNSNGVTADMIIDSTGKVGIGFTNPATSLGINGAVTYVQDNTVTANAATITLAVNNRTFFRISSDAVPASRKLSLGNGLFTGQMLIIQCSAAASNGFRIEDADANIDISGTTCSLLVNDTITFIWDSNEWVELHRSDN